MRKDKRRLPCYFLALAVLISALVFSPAGVLAQDEASQVVVHQIEQPLRAAQQYWTEERMQKAKPMPLPMFAQPPMEVGPMETEVPSGPEFKVPARGPAVIPFPPQRKNILEKAPEPNGAERGLSNLFQVEPLIGIYPFVFSSYQVFPDLPLLYATVFPYRVIGKVFFTIPGSGDYVCSGAVVNTSNMSAVWTAGHCVYSPSIEGWHTNFVFVPARWNGINPWNSWPAKTLASTEGWISMGLAEYDHGGAYMDRGGPTGNNLVGQLGGLGFMANAPRKQHWHVNGYPAEWPFDGEHQNICTSCWGTDDQPTGAPGVDPPAIGLGCDMTGGSSGGPWIANFSGQISPQTNILNGNVSYGYIGLPRIFSPYFGDAALILYNWLDSQPIP
ncbi:MAG: hypothetical protein JRG97_10145 [Deltaproteobacteria bacterium]|nr:hypothetical protein [Deltaproteobacteria bacterium]MBW2053379.1 hypothetical protein [Deltaproteobacteria bacterium]MBW2141415.1 hypothetical protein [Deltaproteobacteria bacterium]MBW2324230.1 hypothetical protein [Deltaproteobacteria bacterium]